MKKEIIETYTELGKRLNKIFEFFGDLEQQIGEIKEVLKNEKNNNEIVNKIKEILNL